MAQWSTSVSTSEERPRGGGLQCSFAIASSPSRPPATEDRPIWEGRRAVPGPRSPTPQDRTRRSEEEEDRDTIRDGDGRTSGRTWGFRKVFYSPARHASFLPSFRRSRSACPVRVRSLASERARHPPWAQDTTREDQVACCARAAVAVPGSQGRGRGGGGGVRVRAHVEGLGRRNRMRGAARPALRTLSLWRVGKKVRRRHAWHEGNERGRIP